MEQTLQEQTQIEMTDKQLAELVMNEQKTYEQSTQAIRTQFDTIFDAYNGKMTDKAYPWKSNKFIPKMRTAISYIMPFLFSGDPEVEVVGVGEEDKFLSSILEKTTNYRINECVEDSFEKLYDWALQAVTYGTSVIQLDWRFERKKMTKQTAKPWYRRLFSDVADETKEYDVTVKDEPDFVVPSIKDIFVDPLIPTIQRQKSLIVRSVLNIEDIKNNPAYTIPEGKELAPKGAFSQNQYNSNSMNQSVYENTDKLKKDVGAVEIYERWTADKIITVVDGREQIVIRNVENPYGFIPFIKLVFEKDPNPYFFYGKGVGQNTIDIQSLFYDLFNQMMDNLKNLGNKMYKVKRGANINKNELVSRPNGFVQVTDIDDVVEFTTTDLKESFKEILSLTSDEFERASGANSLVQGAESGDTYGQDQLRQSNSVNRFELARKRFKKAIGQLGKMLIQMEIIQLQDMNAPIMRLFPMQTRESIFALIKNDAENILYNVKVKGDTIVAQNKDIVSKQLIDLFNVFGQMITPDEQRAWARRILELRGQQDIDGLVAEQAPQIDPMTGMPIQEGQMGGQEIPMMPPMGPMPQGQPTPQGINQSVQV